MLEYKKIGHTHILCKYSIKRNTIWRCLDFHNFSSFFLSFFFFTQFYAIRVDIFFVRNIYLYLLILIHATGAATAESGFCVNRYLFLKAILQELLHRKIQMSLNARQSMTYIRIDLCISQQMHAFKL